MFDPPAPRAMDLLRDPQRHFEALIAQVRDYAIFTVDVSLRATSWNEGVRRVLGFAEHEFVGQDITPVVYTPEALRDGVPEREIEQAMQTGQASDDRWMRRKDGSPFYAAGTTTAVRDEMGEIVGFLKVMRDQTQWKETKSEMQRNLDELARADKARKAFIAILAHELRNPLAPLGNAIQVLKKSARDPARVLSTLALMERQIGQMSRLIADLLDVSRLSHDKIELKRGEVELSTVIDQAMDVMRPQQESMGHAVSVEHSAQALYVDADATRLVQVLANLLNNAFKFTPPNGQVWIATEVEQGEAVIRIRDNGIGVPLEDQARIFEMFSQVDSSRERSHGGLGIGLALVRRLVELHGGSVNVVSAGRGMGSEFTVRLPRIVPHALNDAAEGRQPDADAHVKRILVVDDNEDAAMSLAALLELEGHHASIANSGEAALRIAATEKPQLVILDLGMPGMSGLKVAERLRRDQHDPDPVLVALTGWDQPEDRRSTADAGFDYHLVKPLDQEALRAILGTMN